MIQFLRDNLRTILLATALMLVSGLIWAIYLTTRTAASFSMGFPLQFFLAWGPCPPGRICIEFNIFYLAMDFLLWYAVSAFIFRRAKQ